MYIVFMLTRNIFYGYVALFLTGFSTSLLYAANNLCAEHLAALLMLCVSLFLYKAVKEKDTKYFVLLGAALGLLVLTRGVFQYFIIIILIFLVFLAIVGLFKKRKLLICTIIFSITYFGLIGSWMARNYMHFGRFFITERGGIVLLLRSECNMMNRKEYLGAFLYWAPDKYLSESLLKSFFGEDAIKPGGALERLNRLNDSSFYLRTKAIWAKVEKEFANQKKSEMVDKRLKSMAKTNILQHPVRHILATLPIGWRGLFAEHGYRLKIPGSGIVINSSVPTNIVYFAAFFFLTFLSIKNRWWELFALILPALYLYGIQTALTHNLARYNKPIIPILVIAMLFVVHYITSKRAVQEKE
jgi:4-amino-4-deoxy-L-arabinose transferase-like glycosyltransferase